MSIQQIQLSIREGLLFLVLTLILNSLLAIFGSMLWGFFPYWPAFMVYGLATVYFGWWGILLAVLSPLISAFLSVGDAPFYLYMPINLLQASAFWGAFKLLRIEPRLASWKDRLKYLSCAVAIPSFMGGSLAWLLRSTYPLASDGPFLHYSLAWTVENLVPALLPGIWLHGIIADTYKTFSWESGAKPKSWLRQTLEYSAPWMFSLLMIGLMVVIVVIQHVGWHQIMVDGAPGAWKQIQNQVIAPLPALRLTALALCISLLYSLGCSIVLAKRSWVLVEAVRRHLPSKKFSDLILSGMEVPSQRRSTTIVISDILNFDKAVGSLSADDLVAWLNSYFSNICDLCVEAKGSVINLFGGEIVLAFGLQSSSSGAIEAIRCAVSMHEALGKLNSQLSARGLPAVHAGFSIHSGSVITGDLGSPDRRLFSVVGQTVDVASCMLHALRSLPFGVIPIVMSRETMREAGLFTCLDHDRAFLEFSMSFPGIDNPDSLFAIRAETLSLAVDLLDRSNQRQLSLRSHDVTA